MRCPAILIVSSCLLAAATVPLAADPIVTCGVRSLADAIEHAQGTNPVISFTGVCGPIVVTKDGVSLHGVGEAVIDGGGQDAVTVDGASRITLTGVEIRNGQNGIIAVNGAHISLSEATVHDNAGPGILVHTGSTAALANVTTRDNLFGLDVRNGAAVTVTGTLTASSNTVFGINVNGGAFNLSKGTVTASGNALGIQIATGGNAFLNDSESVINATNNFSTGLTVVSGAQLVSFGGTINASGNPVAGVTVNSKAGLDMDAATMLNSTGNGDGLRIQQDSVMTVFNNPMNTGQAGFSTINTSNNTGSGVRVLTGSTLTLVNRARVISKQNALGFAADNGAGVVLVNSEIIGNTTIDVSLTFGTRFDSGLLQFVTYACDNTVLVRGTSGIVCPH